MGILNFVKTVDRTIQSRSLESLPDLRDGVRISKSGVTIESQEYTSAKREKTRNVVDYSQEFYVVSNLPLSDAEAEFLGLSPRSDGQPYLVNLFFPNNARLVDFDAIKKFVTSDSSEQYDLSRNSYLVQIRDVLRFSGDQSGRTAEVDILSNIANTNPDKPIHILLGSDSNRYYNDQIQAKIIDTKPSQASAIIDLTEYPTNRDMLLNRSYKLPTDHPPYFFNNPAEGQINVRLRTDDRPLTNEEKAVLSLRKLFPNTFQKQFSANQLKFLSYIKYDSEGNPLSIDMYNLLKDEEKEGLQN